MMILNSHTMRGVKVVTRSGQAIGKVASFDLDAATGRLVALRVRANGLMTGLLDQELTVSFDAIIEMTRTQVVIADGSVQVARSAFAGAEVVTTPPVMMKE